MVGLTCDGRTTRSSWIAITLLLVGACSDDGAPATGTATDDSVGDATAVTASASTTGGDASTGGSASLTGETSAADGTSVGSSSGGSTGGTASSSGGSDSGGPGGGCVQDGDCVLFEDCCSCAAVPVDDVPPVCESKCDQTACDAVGIGDGVHCELGTCQLDEVGCNQQTVVCAEIPPKCGAGTLPSVAEGCWTGNCVPAEACDVVPDCSDCPEGQTCVPLLAKGPAGFRCSPIAPACNGTPDCTCMDGVCPDPFSACIETDGGVQCECPAC
ncbi:MAG: hypothetical protein U0168_07345 [Nannocystaceae bacterium]